jgi:hypothetical protein
VTQHMKVHVAVESRASLPHSESVAYLPVDRGVPRLLAKRDASGARLSRSHAFQPLNFSSLVHRSSGTMAT